MNMHSPGAYAAGRDGQERDRHEACDRGDGSVASRADRGLLHRVKRQRLHDACQPHPRGRRFGLWLWRAEGRRRPMCAHATASSIAIFSSTRRRAAAGGKEGETCKTAGGRYPGRDRRRFRAKKAGRISVEVGQILNKRLPDFGSSASRRPWTGDRAGTAADDELLVRHYLAIWESYGTSEGSPVPDAEARVHSFIEEARKHRKLGAFFALVDKKCVGSIACNLYVSPYPVVKKPEHQLDGYIWHVFVDAGHRGGGIATDTGRRCEGLPGIDWMHEGDFAFIRRRRACVSPFGLCLGKGDARAVALGDDAKSISPKRGQKPNNILTFASLFRISRIRRTGFRPVVPPVSFPSVRGGVLSDQQSGNSA